MCICGKVGENIIGAPKMQNIDSDIKVIFTNNAISHVSYRFLFIFGVSSFLIFVISYLLLILLLLL